MHLSWLWFILGLSLIVGANPVKPSSPKSGKPGSSKPVKSGSINEGDSRLRCGVVAFEPDGRVWMVASKKDGYILPKGGYDEDEDSNMHDCVEREAKEEAGVEVDRDSIEALPVKDGSVHWFKCTVSSHGARTDPELAKRKPPKAYSVPKAWEMLKKGDQEKKQGMHKALRAATEE
ncbi:Putative NUDIX hydrolase domain-containing protein [Colletotrichum destructivum]|uniref:NUDIX hydrolase domain-containing protein n=1 Tax=Colletotrichum destructivum TaxID=34406 RepID=A0AAX4ICR6_9PEZI|nr:Putative NUDIX hydrolase domain-containing protein [Colletotrichum destructivum]